MKLIHALAAVAAIALSTGTAKAADLAKPAPAPVVDDAPAPRNPWTGLYIEGGLGMTANTMEISAEGDSLTFGDTAWAGHVGIGADMMFAQHWVAGVFGRAHMDDIAFKEGGTKIADTKLTYSVGARLGYVPRNDWMVYALAGYRFASLDTVGAPDIDTNAWLVGAGIEAMITDRWFIGIEGVAALGQSDTLADEDVSVKFKATDYTGTIRTGFKF